MSSQVGIVCGRCDWFNPRDGQSCEDCGNDLVLTSLVAETTRTDEVDASCPEPSSARVVVDLTTGPPPEVIDSPLAEVDSGLDPSQVPLVDQALVVAAETEGVVLVRPMSIGISDEEERRRSKEREMEQARHYICKSCYSPVPGGHKFCGKCGAPTNFAEDYASTQYFGAMQVPNKAKLILIKGEGLDGISYHLNSTEHVAGRQQGAILFPDDSWLSPRHANFFYRDNKLFVRDEESINGIYLRIREPATLEPGNTFLCGEQMFRVETADALNEGPESDGTYFYASPTKSWSFRVVQILPGGAAGITAHDDGGKITIGREDCLMNFINDDFLSFKHTEISADDGKFTLTDLESQNGTFIRIDQEQALVHGDYVFLGKQLLRVEVTP